jgi:hypothetical protein
MPSCRRHEKENYTKKIPSNGPKQIGIENWLQINKFPIEEIECKIDLGKPEISLFGFKTHNIK